MYKRKITSITNETFYYNDHEVIGYLVGGQLTTKEPTKRDKEMFEGDWSEVTLADVWSYIHNGDRQPVTFCDGKKFVTYYPRRADDTFLRVAFTMKEVKKK